MDGDVHQIRQQALDEIAAAEDLRALEACRVRYLGKKGRITGLLKGLGALPAAERPAAGQAINAAKKAVEAAIRESRGRLEQRQRQQEEAGRRIDVSLPGFFVPPGRLHPVTQVMNEICGIFARLGFDVAEGPEVEDDWHNFEALNIPPEHPARDMQDTFYLRNGLLLRTHTSPVQIRVMQRRRPPVRIIAPGKVYRCDSDQTHTPMFHQVEGLLVDRDVSMADLKGTLEFFLHSVFGPETPIRLRPSYFPFTEPSAEIDIGCVICGGDGCGVCKETGWIEILGAGMVNPRVFEAAGYDPAQVSGFAFGLGVERIAMLKYGIDDLRLFFENDIRFLEQFG